VFVFVEFVFVEFVFVVVVVVMVLSVTLRVPELDSLVHPYQVVPSP